MKRFLDKDFVRKEWRLLTIAIMALLIVLLLLAIPSCGNYREDCMVEEIVEEVIQSQTDIDLDLTPGSPE